MQNIVSLCRYREELTAREVSLIPKTDIGVTILTISPWRGNGLVSGVKIEELSPKPLSDIVLQNISLKRCLNRGLADKKAILNRLFIHNGDLYDYEGFFPLLAFGVMLHCHEGEIELMRNPKSILGWQFRSFHMEDQRLIGEATERFIANMSPKAALLMDDLLDRLRQTMIGIQKPHEELNYLKHVVDGVI